MQPAHQLVQGRGWRPASPDGWRPWREARGPRSAPQDPSGSGSSSPLVIPSSYAPQQQRNQTRRGPKGLPALPGLGCEARAGPCVAELAGAPAGRVTDICRSIALGSGGTRRGPELFTRGRAERHRSGACPQQTHPPRPHPTPLGGPVHGSCPGPRAGKRRVRQVRRSNHLAGSSSGHNE
jgi:hypothetical protein